MRVRIWWSENLGSTAESSISFHWDFVESYLFSFLWSPFPFFFNLFVLLMLRKYHEINTSICKTGYKRGSD